VAPDLTLKELGKRLNGIYLGAMMAHPRPGRQWAGISCLVLIIRATFGYSLTPPAMR
jgi:hypothetical protein